MAKAAIIPIHPKPPLHWLVKKSKSGLLSPSPWTWVMPDLKLFRK